MPFHKRLAAFWQQEGMFTLLLVVLLVQIFVVLPFFPKGGFERFLLPIFYFILLVTGLISVAESNKKLIVLCCVAALIIQVSARLALNANSFRLFSDVFYTVYCATLSAIVLIKTLEKGPITIKRIEGSIVAYLLFGLAFALLFHAIYMIKGHEAFNGLRSREEDEFLYFSLTTLTTTGYGDISPVATSARSLANMESLIGQLYPAILIARLVSMQLMNPNENKKNHHTND